MSERYRIEHDSQGELRVPAQALYGAQTQRAVENFPISELRMPGPFVRALGRIKSAAARVNADLGLLDTCAWRITSHTAIKDRSSYRVYLFRPKFELSAWLSAVSLLIFEDLISSSGPGMRKRL
jgi:hypothetical protein